MPSNEPFVFYTERRLVALTGVRARNAIELAAALRVVPGSSVFYHTHHQYLSHHFERPVFFNDFAIWVSEALQQPRLAEELAAIDLLQFTSIRNLREAILAELDEFVATGNGGARECPPGDEFHFAKSKSFVMRTGLEASDPADFALKLPETTNISVFYHFFLARLRLERPTSDFAEWFRQRGEEKLARAVDRLDPYSVTLDELRDQIAALVKSYLRG